MKLVQRKLRRAAATLCAAAVILAGAGCLHAASSAVPVSAKAVQPAGISLPILMYHSMLPPSVLHGRYIVSPTLFEQDLQYLQKEGYTAVTMQDLLNAVNGEGTLPKKPVMLSFDDGYYNNYKYAFPLVKKYHMKMVLSPIGICTEQFSKADSDHLTYSHVTWKELNEMLQSGCVEVQNHTYNLHQNHHGRLGASKRRSESVADYQKMLQEDLTHNQALFYEHTGVHMNTFVYPFGAVSEAAGDVIHAVGFRATLTCTEKMNHITQDPACLYELGRFLRPPDLSPAQFFAQKILSAEKKTK
ncbi:MAG: polysaccharide deacetylase family protein [Oscillospiraceae bacterium]|nr:polysaccharide deacetylase family protein [Oscillospiraceae bacterium]